MLLSKFTKLKLLFMLHSNLTMKPYSKLSAKEKSMHAINGAIQFNLFTLSNSVQNLLSYNFDPSLHTDTNSCLERCIKDMDSVFIKHSKLPYDENETKKSTDEDA